MCRYDEKKVTSAFEYIKYIYIDTVYTDKKDIFKMC